MIREIPILYSTPMVQAKLARRKTQTRRIIKESFNGCLTNGGPHPCPNDPVVFYPGEVFDDLENPDKKITIDSPYVQAVFHCSTLDSVAKCPYGKPGDLLWGRESFIDGEDYPCWEPEEDENPRFAFKADCPVDQLKVYKWKPSIHMPKIAARIWDRIVEIRVERLQDISEDDAIAEGIGAGFQMNAGWPDYLHIRNGVCELTQDCPIMSYATLWESINGPGSWELNPWVWVIETEQLSTTGRPNI